MEYDGHIYYKANEENKITKFYQVGYIDGEGRILDEISDLKISRDGKKFEGWTSEEEGQIEDIDYRKADSFKLDTENLTIYAVWSEDIPVIEKFKVEYFGNGNTGASPSVDNKEYSRGDLVIVLGRNDLVKIGYSFAGWNTKPDGRGENYSIGSSFEIKENTSLYGRWTKDNPVGPNPDLERPVRPRPQPDETVEIIFSEIPLGDKLDKLNHKAYIFGYPDTTIRANNDLTREEASAVFYRLLTDDYRKKIFSNSNGFKDVDQTRWSIDDIGTLSKGKIIEGYPDGSFKPTNKITRAEVAVMSSKFDRLTPKTENKFKDVDNHWAINYINSASARGWIVGDKNNNFRPNDYITRAEFVTLINKVLDRKVNIDNMLEGKKDYLDLDSSKWYYLEIQEAVNGHEYKRLEDGSEKWTKLK